MHTGVREGEQKAREKYEGENSTDVQGCTRLGQTWRAGYAHSFFPNDVYVLDICKKKTQGEREVQIIIQNLF
jgi:phage-related protein